MYTVDCLNACRDAGYNVYQCSHTGQLQSPGTVSVDCGTYESGYIFDAVSAYADEWRCFPI